MPSLDQIGPDLPGIAKRAIESELCHGVRLARDARQSPKAAVFVTLRNPDGSLRGCVGSIVPAEPDVIAETARSAVLAATRDPRFPPVSRSEIQKLAVEVSVLEPEEQVTDESALDPFQYGVIVRDRFGRRGLLLPDIDGIYDAATQVAVAKQKAGIGLADPVLLSRFRVRKYKAPAG